MVGDEIFQLKDYLVRPYQGGRRGKLPIDQAVFIYRLSRARRVLENSFGILVARWRLFRKPIRAVKDNVTSYTLAAVTLHNNLQQTENASYCPRGEDMSIQKLMQISDQENGDVQFMTISDVLSPS